MCIFPQIAALWWLRLGKSIDREQNDTANMVPTDIITLLMRPNSFSNYDLLSSEGVACCNALNMGMVDWEPQYFVCMCACIPYRDDMKDLLECRDFSILSIEIDVTINVQRCQHLLIA